MPRSIHLFSSAGARKDATRPPRAHERRDLAAAFELLRPLLARGFVLGEHLLNHPPADVRLGPRTPRARIDTSACHPGDIILWTTRPALSDRHEGANKQVEPGYTDLEANIHAALRVTFGFCARNRVTLSAPVRQSLPTQQPWLADLGFKQNSAGAPLAWANAMDGGGRIAPRARTTVAFLVFLEELWRGGPSFLGAFGLDGTATLAWCHWLARGLGAWPPDPGLTLGVMRIGDIPERPLSLAWAETWQVELHACPIPAAPAILAPWGIGTSRTS
jgi:hypothetical protein